MLKKNRKNVNDPSKEGVIEFINIDQQVFLKPQRIDLPAWYKDLPIFTKLREHDQIEDFTVKRCIPVLDALTTGYHLVTTVDYHFKYNPETGESEISGDLDVLSNKPITMHPVTQLGNTELSPEYIRYAYKWGNSWLIKTPPGYSCMFVHPLDGIHLPFKTLDGVVDTDKYIMPVLFPFLMKNNFEGTIPAGTPVVQIIPFKRDDWKMVVTNKIDHELHHQYDGERIEYEKGRYHEDGTPAGGMYKRDYRVKKRYR